jgi:phage terminase large subunit-like protein
MRQPREKRSLMTLGHRSYSEVCNDYAIAVVDGRVLSSKWAKLACKRYLDDLSRASRGESRWTYSAEKAHRVCGFCELLSHTKGQLQGTKIKLEPWQIFIICNIFGWLGEDGNRRFREAFLLIPRGNGKSPLAAWLALWMAFFDGEPGAEVYCGAAGEKQAKEVFKVAAAQALFTPELATRFGIEFNAASITQPSTLSTFTTVIGKPKDGASIYFAILDELHEQLDASQYETFKTGAAKRKGSLVMTISTAGSTLEGPCHSLQQDVEKLLEGSIVKDRYFGLIHCADESVDWTSIDALEMANPNFRVSMDWELLREDQLSAVQNSSRQNSFRNKHLNQWTNAATAWMNMARWSASKDESLTRELVAAKPGVTCHIGSDLASRLDLASTTTLFRHDLEGKPHYFAFCRSYLPEDQIDDPSNQHYQRWRQSGHLIATEGGSLDFERVEQDTIADILAFPIKEIAYDERYAGQYAQRIAKVTGVTQVKILPVPAELSPAMKELESAVADGRFHHDGDPVLTWCMSNLLSSETSLGNYTLPYKQRAENKIDAAISLLIAMCRARLAKPAPKRASFKPFLM